MLKVSNIEVLYQEVILALKGVSLEVPSHGIVALLGANSAGKSTTLKAISGLLKHENGRVAEGSIEFLGERIDRKSAEEIARMGIIQVIEGRRVFEHLTVEQNLVVGGHLRTERGAITGGLAPLLIKEIFEILTRLNEKEGIPILLVEQNAKLALSVARYAYVLETGRVVMDGDSEKLRENPDIRDFYLGLTDLGMRKSFRAIKHYKRRKRWVS